MPRQARRPRVDRRAQSRWACRRCASRPLRSTTSTTISDNSGPALRRDRRRDRHRQVGPVPRPGRTTRRSGSLRRGRQRRCNAAVPRHGHRHRQAHRRSSGEASRTTFSMCSRSATSRRVADYQAARPRDHRRHSGAGRRADARRRLRALRVERSVELPLSRHGCGHPCCAGGRAGGARPRHPVPATARPGPRGRARHRPAQRSAAGSRARGHRTHGGAVRLRPARRRPSCGGR